MSSNKEFFYCYSPVLHVFLKERGLTYICTGLNENTLRKFWQYQRDDMLKVALDAFNETKPTDK